MHQILIEIILFAICIVITSAVIIYISKKMIADIRKQLADEYDEYKEELQKNNNILIDDIIEAIKFKNNNINKEESLIKTFELLRTSIKENCAHKMEKINAARLAIYLFHNGTSSTHGITFFKVSCICEKVLMGSGVKERHLEHSNIPINLFDPMVEDLINNGRCIIINDEHLADTNKRIFISHPKIKYSQAVSIFDSNNNLLGFVLAEMTNEYSAAQANKEKDDLGILVKQLAPIFSYSLDKMVSHHNL